MKRATQRTSLHPKINDKLVMRAESKGRTVSNLIAEYVTDGLSDGRYVLKGLSPELEAEMLAGAKKENRTPENFIETALKVYLKRVEYVPIYH